jgi:hypothetical protein
VLVCLVQRGKGIEYDWTTDTDTISKLPVRYWRRTNDPDAYLVLSTNTAASIRAAQWWWASTGSASVLVIGAVCALAWWHQRRLRKVFRDEADSLGIPTVNKEGARRESGSNRSEFAR